jgi:Fur family ferric uptake transcriptional regulator
MKKAIFDPVEILHTQSLKATPIRIALLETLSEIKIPHTIENLQKLLKKRSGDIATLYRSLALFTEAGIVKKIPIETGVYSYELTRGRHHNHHVICSSCGIIESIPFCIKNIHLSAVKKSKIFRVISHHTVAFSGTCKKCVRGVR